MLPNKGFNQPVAKSQQNSGTQLDECCGEITESPVSALADAHSIPLAEASKLMEVGLKPKQPYGKR